MEAEHEELLQRIKVGAKKLWEGDHPFEAKAVELAYDLLKQAFEGPQTTYCAYCGERYELDDEAATKITEHIHKCPKHPMRTPERHAANWRWRWDALRSELVGLVSSLCKEHDTIIDPHTAAHAAGFLQETMRELEQHVEYE